MTPTRWSVISAASLVGLIVLPVAGALVAGGTILTLAVGSATWLASVAFKARAARWLNRAVGEQSMHIIAALQGLLSANAELGFAYLALVAFKIASVPNALAFGVGAAAAEVVYVLFKGVTAARNEQALLEWERGARTSLCVRYSVPIERLVASIGHVSSRGLAFASLKLPLPGGLWPAAAAIFFFSLTDGAAYYGHLLKWNWSDPKVCRTFHGALAVLAALELSLMVFALG